MKLGSIKPIPFTNDELNDATGEGRSFFDSEGYDSDKKCELSEAMIDRINNSKYIIKEGKTEWLCDTFQQALTNLVEEVS